MKKKVLIADDSMFMRNLLKSILEKAGYEVIGEASDGIMAVELYELLKPDVMTLDITMPRLSGVDTLKSIKKIDKDAKVIMCSSMGQKAFIEETIKSGAVNFLVKPFKPEAVIAALEKALK